jgi:hypothetical protein
MPRELTAVSTADACRDLAAAGATGRLRVTHLRGDGEVGFERGRVVSATSPATGARIGDRLVSAGLLSEEALREVLHTQAELEPGRRPRLGRLLVAAGLVAPDAVRAVVEDQVIDAIFELTTWERATLEFLTASPHDTPEVPLSMAVDQLLVEVARRRDEWETLSRVIPDLGAVPRFREGTSASTAALEPDEFAVLASVDGERTIRELAEDLGYGEFEAARVIYALVLLGLVEVVRPVDEIGAALDDALAFEPPGGARGLAPDDTREAPRPRSAPDAALPAHPPGDDETARWAVAHEGRPLPAAPEPPAPATDATTSRALAEDAPASEAPTRRGEPSEGPTAPTDERSAAPAGEGPTTPTDERSAVPAEEGPAAPPDEGSDRGLSAFAELRAFTAGESVDDPAPPPPATPSTDAEGHLPGPPGDPGHDAGTAPRAPRPSPDGDVSEFLRELSRLALDDGGDDTPPPPSSDATPPARPSPRPHPAPQRDEPKKRRRLFGRGG